MMRGICWFDKNRIGLPICDCMLIGHGKIFENLKSLGRAGRLHHAQLFVGPQHVGKTKVARLLSVFLQGAQDNIILKKQILEGMHSDTLLFLDDGENLPIETVRQIVERGGQTHASPYLIFVIENLGRMRPEAMNALLRYLEEPYENTIFFLTANEEDDVLPTIRSRCHVTNFQTVSEELLKEVCGENVYVEQLLLFAMGRPGKLRRLLDDSEYFQAHQTLLEDILRFLENPSTPSAFELTRKYEGHDLLPEMLDILLQRARTLAMSSKVPPVLNHMDFTRVVDSIESCKQDLKNNVNRKLSLENLLLPFVP